MREKDWKYVKKNNQVEEGEIRKERRNEIS
jgi:hypothetical protein